MNRADYAELVIWMLTPMLAGFIYSGIVEELAFEHFALPLGYAILAQLVVNNMGGE